MIYQKLFERMISLGLILVFLIGCSSTTPVPPTPAPPSATPQPTSTSTPTITPTITSSPTSTPVPIPPIPTLQVLDEYEDQIVEITDLQGKKTTVKVRTVETEDAVLNDSSSLFWFPLKLAKDIYTLIWWKNFRRAYLSGSEYVVTLEGGQEIKGQLDFDLVDPDGNVHDLQSVSSMVLVGLSKTWLPPSTPGIPSRPEFSQRWQLHVSEPEDLTFTVLNPRFTFEYTLNTVDSQGNVIFTESDKGSADFFSLEESDVERKLSSYDEIRFGQDNQITAVANGVETTGTLFLIPDFESGVTFDKNKGTSSNWYLEGYWLEQRLPILLKTPLGTLTKGAP